MACDERGMDTGNRPQAGISKMCPQDTDKYVRDRQGGASYRSSAIPNLSTQKFQRNRAIERLPTATNDGVVPWMQPGFLSMAAVDWGVRRTRP